MIIPDLNELVSLHDAVEIFVKPFVLKLENKNPNHVEHGSGWDEERLKFRKRIKLVFR